MCPVGSKPAPYFTSSLYTNFLFALFKLYAKLYITILFEPMVQFQICFEYEIY